MTLRPGILYAALSVIFGVVAAVVVRSTATEGLPAVNPLIGSALIVLVGSLILGLPQVMASSTVLIMGAVMVEAGLSDDPSWIRALVIGCLWFVTIETGWEALDRRDGSRRSAGSVAWRVQEVTTVVVVALILGLVAAVSTSLAPSRTVLLQALVLGLVIGTFATMLRRVAMSEDT